MDRLDENLARIQRLKQLSGCKILLAVKGFSAPQLFSPMKDVLDGISASGLYEARLGREQFGKYVQTYSPAFRPQDISEIKKYSDAVVFNSIQQLKEYGNDVRSSGCMCGIRINPMQSYIWKNDTDPCMRYSRLGIPLPDVNEELLRSVDGIHFHVMCEQKVDSLESFVRYIVEKMGALLKKASHLKWINLGGGQLIGRDDYDIERAAKILRWFSGEYDLEVILEPCEGIVTQCGFFATQVCDIISNHKQTAILDASPVCHMPDAVFRGWRHSIRGEVVDGEGIEYFLSGPTCFAGDTFGSYKFPKPLKTGDILFFEDTAAYTWVKNNTFNGMPMPTLCTYREKEGLSVLKTYSYDLYRDSL